MSAPSRPHEPVMGRVGAGPAIRHARTVAANGMSVALGRRLALAGALLAALAVLATLVFAAAWAVGGSARVAERSPAAVPPTDQLELSSDYAPSLAPRAAPLTGLVIVTDLHGATHVVPGRVGTGGA